MNVRRVAMLIGLGMSSVSTAAEKPNVLFIFSDDQRADTIAALGNEHIVTPNLDRLVEDGFVFRNAYCLGGNTGAVCIPSRNMVMTGQSWFRFPGGGRSPQASAKGPTFPKSMKAAGYETYYEEKSGKANLPKIQRQFDHYRDVNMVAALLTGYAAQRTVDRAISFLANDRDASKPFFMYLGLPCPHDPRIAAPEFRRLYDWRKIPPPANFLPIHPFDNGELTVRDEMLEMWPRKQGAIQKHLRDYYALITSMDRDIGRLLDALVDQGLWNNTIIVFSSDHGLAMGSHGLMGKQNLYEDGMKVPLIVRGPGIPKGESDALVYLLDIYPTLVELAGGEAPAGIDGRSLVGVIQRRQANVRDALLLAYKGVQRAVRDDRWKLHRYPQANRTQLFDLENDPHETNDLAADPRYAAQVHRMLKLMADEQDSYGDHQPLTSAEPIDASVTAAQISQRAANDQNRYIRTVRGWVRNSRFGRDVVPIPGEYSH